MNIFHHIVEEMIKTLDDMPCLLHLPIHECLLDHTTITKDGRVRLLVELLESNSNKAYKEVEKN